MADDVVVAVSASSEQLLCVRALPEASGWLDTLVPGLSTLGLCRQLAGKGDVVGVGHGLWLRLGPDEWWCWRQAQEAWAHDLPRAIAEQAEGQPHACVALGEGHQAFFLPDQAGPILSFGCDLDWQSLPLNFAGRTRLGGFSVVLARQPDRPQAMMLWVEASLGRSLQHWLQKAEQLRGRP